MAVTLERLTVEEVERRKLMIREAGRRLARNLAPVELDTILPPVNCARTRGRLRHRQAVIESNLRRARPKQERVERWVVAELRRAGRTLSVPELVELGCEASETLLRRLAVAMVARGELVRRAEGRPTERKRSDGSPMRVLVPVTVYSLPAGVEDATDGD